MDYRRLLRWAALPILDRKWAAPLSAVALGFGLFIGVAIGPGAAGTLATGVTQIEVPEISDVAGDQVVEEDGDDAPRRVAAAADPENRPASSSSAPCPFRPLSP